MDFRVDFTPKKFYEIGSRNRPFKKILITWATVSVTRWLDYFFTLRPFTTMSAKKSEFFPKVGRFKILPNAT